MPLTTSLQPELAVEGVLGREPLTALTANMRKVIGGMLQKCEDGMRETFFETCVANTAHDLAKGAVHYEAIPIIVRTLRNLLLS